MQVIGRNISSVAICYLEVQAIAFESVIDIRCGKNEQGPISDAEFVLVILEHRRRDAVILIGELCNT